MKKKLKKQKTDNDIHAIKQENDAFHKAEAVMDLGVDIDEELPQHQTITIFEDQHEIHAAEEDSAENLTLKPKDKYKFIRSIGFGGMKAVLQVKDKDTTRKMAMAIIPDFRDRPKSEIARFIREARITARLEHPNIVPIHDIGVDSSGSPYFTMKYLRGKSLATIIKKLRDGNPEYLARYDLPRLLRIFVKVCNAIAFAHSRNVIHLDLKPENIHVGDFGEVLVLDWGLSKFVGVDDDSDDENEDSGGSSSEIMTLDGVAKGTPGYMAPEQAAGKNREKDERTDIYGLGCILYSILIFESPLSGKDVQKLLEDTIRGNIQTPSEVKNVNRPIPAAMEAICLKAMERYPAHRYQNVSELREDIFAFMAGFATKAENASSLKKTVLFINRNFLMLVFIITFILLVAIVGSLTFLYVNKLITINF